jgi:hypothetical protein
LASRKFFPRTAQELIEYMEKSYPEPQLDHTIPPDELRFVSGQRSVVRRMRREFDIATSAKDLPDSVFD